jgi:uncharacterized membrane protein YkoI
MTRRSTSLVLAAAVAGLAVTAHAGESKKGPSEQEEARAALLRHEILPLSQILRITAQRLPGDVLKVEIERDHGVLIYELKVLARTGRIREIKLDARTGAVLEIEDD